MKHRKISVKAAMFGMALGGVMMNLSTVASGEDRVFEAARQSDLKSGTPGHVTEPQENVKRADCPVSEMQARVQKVLDDAVASGAQTAVQCCVYIGGRRVVDAWAGTYEKEGGRPIDGDSLIPIFSTEKQMFVTALHRAVELGKINYDDKVAQYWPEFANHGKEGTTIREVLSHRTGLSGLPLPGTPDDSVCNWEFMVDQCANMSPHIAPGTKSEYLGITYAWLLGEPLSRAMKQSLNDVLREQVLIPAGIDHDFYFALDDEAVERCVTVYDGVEKYGFEQMNKDCFRRACIPSAYAAASARGIAKFYLRLTGMDGAPPLIRPETLANALKPCRWEGEPIPEAEALNKTWQTVWGLGYGLWGERDELSRIIGAGGLGGSEGFADLKNKIVMGYTCAVSATACGKPYDLRPDIYRIVGIKTRYTK